MPTNPPTGTVTFLFTDIEGSTKLAQGYPDALPALLARHNEILNRSIEAHNGYAFRIVGDSFTASFHNANDAIWAAMAGQQLLHKEAWAPAPIKVRMGIHTGKADFQENGDYRGYLTMSHVQRLMSAAHGGQVLVSFATQQLIRDDMPEGVTLLDMGERRLKDLIRPEHIYQLVIPNLPADFPPIKTLDIYRHNLPAQMTSFIGRETELAEIKQALSAYRLVTLTGSGGAGKSRLSLQGRGFCTNFRWCLACELAPVTDPLVLQTCSPFSTCGRTVIGARGNLIDICAVKTCCSS
jgi:class 3 adenylate cyclase